jgi:hypothetical protein
MEISAGHWRNHSVRRSSLSWPASSLASIGSHRTSGSRHCPVGQPQKPTSCPNFLPVRPNFLSKFPLTSLSHTPRPFPMENSDWSGLVTLVLQRYQNLTRGPYGVDDALQKAKQAPENSISRILSDRSESAWRAYFSADKASRSNHGFSGKANLTRLLDGLSGQPPASQRVFADQLASRMESEVNASAPSPKKRRMCPPGAIDFTF